VRGVQAHSRPHARVWRAFPHGPTLVRSRTYWQSALGEPTVTVLLRHGQTPMSVQKRYAGRSDVPLTDVGVQQAAAAAKRLASAGLGVIVTSPLLRAAQTAQEVAAVTGAAVVTDEGFRETDFGAWEGLTFAEVRERWPAEVTAWLADPEVAPPGGESFADVSLRVTAALHRVLAAREGQTVLIVSHVTPIKTLVTAALLAPPAALYRMHLDVAALSEIDWYADGPAVLRTFNDTGHLSDQ
jgi:ribonuclease H / adenosylcobalamin/alpha-ribazole phosphatase